MLQPGDNDSSVFLEPSTVLDDYSLLNECMSAAVNFF